MSAAPASLVVIDGLVRRSPPSTGFPRGYWLPIRDAAMGRYVDLSATDAPWKINLDVLFLPVSVCHYSQKLCLDFHTGSPVQF